MSTRSHEEYKKYKESLNSQVWEKFGPSYCMPSVNNGSWRTTIPYRKEVVDYVILQTRVYLRLVEYYGLALQQWDFMTALTNKIADWLAVYLERNPGLDGRDAEYKHKWAVDYVKDEIVNKFDYVQRLKKQVQKIKAQNASEKYAEIKRGNATTISSNNQKKI